MITVYMQIMENKHAYTHTRSPLEDSIGHLLARQFNERPVDGTCEIDVIPIKFGRLLRRICDRVGEMLRDKAVLNASIQNYYPQQIPPTASIASAYAIIYIYSYYVLLLDETTLNESTLTQSKFFSPNSQRQWPPKLQISEPNLHSSCRPWGAWNCKEWQWHLCAFMYSDQCVSVGKIKTQRSTRHASWTCIYATHDAYWRPQLFAYAAHGQALKNLEDTI